MYSAARKIQGPSNNVGFLLACSATRNEIGVYTSTEYCHHTAAPARYCLRGAAATLTLRYYGIVILLWSPWSRNTSGLPHLCRMLQYFSNGWRQHWTSHQQPIQQLAVQGSTLRLYSHATVKESPRPSHLVMIKTNEKEQFNQLWNCVIHKKQPHSSIYSYRYFVSGAIQQFTIHHHAAVARWPTMATATKIN